VHRRVVLVGPNGSRSGNPSPLSELWAIAHSARDLPRFWGISKVPDKPFIHAYDRNGGLNILKAKAKGPRRAVPSEVCARAAGSDWAGRPTCNAEMTHRRAGRSRRPSNHQGAVARLYDPSVGLLSGARGPTRASKTVAKHAG